MALRSITGGALPPMLKAHTVTKPVTRKIFAGGDAVRGADLVVTAMAEGAARRPGDRRLAGR